MATMTFLSWKRSKVMAAAERAGGRLKGKLPLALKDTATGVEVTDDVPVFFTAASEIAGLNPSAIRHLAPKPSTPDAETTKLVHVDFHDPDLPWRYSPRAVDGIPDKQFYPWMVLLVGTGEELNVDGGLVTRVDAAVLNDHDLVHAHRWGHVQTEAGVTISRLVSPRILLPQRQYVAALVPTFDAAGDFRWAGGVLNGGALPAYYSWRFWTAEEGDFETLATALKLRRAGDLGKAKVRYHRPVTNVDVTIEARGAITSLQPPTPDDAAVLAARADLDALNDPIPDVGLPTREIVQLPSYGRLWLEDPDKALWGRTLNDDPRHRGIAGLGLWLGIVEQESLMNAAVEQAGALQDAAQRIGHLALGLDAARRLWQRRLPEADALRLRVFGPAMGRMLAEGGGTVLARVTSDHSTLDAAIFSSAAQRLLRNGTARARFGATGRIDRRKVLDAANQPMALPPKTPNGMPHVDDVAGKFGERTLEGAFDLPKLDEDRLERLIKEFDGRPKDPSTVAEFARRVDDELRLACSDLIRGFLTDLNLMPPAVLDRAILLAAIDRCRSSKLNDRIREAGLDTVLPSPPTPDERRPIDLGALSKAVASAIDPTVARPPAWQRVASTIGGLTLQTLAPAEAPIGLDYPTWTLVNTHAPEWLLPGADSLPRDSIVALKTNPTFIDAFMVGINTQFLAELRWRNLPAPRVSTPLRMFWGYVNHQSGKREADIRPVGDWPSKAPVDAAPDDVGALSHQAIKPGDTTGKEDLVIAFRTPLFRRYPSTLVYLVRPLPGDNVDDALKAPPKFDDSPTDRAQRRCFGPIFFGQMAPDLVFFAFDVDPSTLDEYWLVLDEPPSELRFRNNQGLALANGARLAAKAIDKPTRVAISGAVLEQQALDG